LKLREFAASHRIWHATCSITLARDESPPALMTLGTIRSNFKEN